MMIWMGAVAPMLLTVSEVSCSGLCDSRKG